MLYPIRAARLDDTAAMIDVERAAGEMFREVGMEAIADDAPSHEELASYIDDARAFVAVDERDRPVGYALVDLVDRAAHIGQVSVHPASARRGIGRQLVDGIAQWASDRALRRSH